MAVGEVPTIRMLVLETDEPDGDTQDEHGSFGEILHRHFSKAGANHTPPLGVETDRRLVVSEKGGAVPTFDEVKDYHAILITGSCFDAHGDNDWIIELISLLREIWTRLPDCKLSGVCFGHQVICRMFGATVEPDSDGKWELGHTRLDLTPIGKRLFNTKSSFVELHQMHQDRVVSPPTPASAKGLLKPDTTIHVWGSSPHTKVQGIYIHDRVFTTQAHLAFNKDMVRSQIQIRIESGALEDVDHANEAKETAHLEHDGDLVAAAILRFFHGDDSNLTQIPKQIV